MKIRPVRTISRKGSARPIGWLVGFVDGEGCFSAAPIVRNRAMTGSAGRSSPRSHVVQTASRVETCSKRLVEFFGCGTVYVEPPSRQPSEDLYALRRVAFGDLRDVIVPFFEEHPLRTAKRDDFAKFAEVIELMEHRRHLTVPGLIEIAEIAQTMNRRKPSEVVENPQRPYARPSAQSREKRMRWSEPCGDIGRLAERQPAYQVQPPDRFTSNSSERNSLSGKFRPARMA